jgi:hypothetical protein
VISGREGSSAASVIRGGFVDEINDEREKAVKYGHVIEVLEGCSPFHPAELRVPCHCDGSQWTLLTITLTIAPQYDIHDNIALSNRASLTFANNVTH